MKNALTIYVPTRARVEHEFTLRNLPPSWLARTIVICPASEAKTHAKNFPKLHGIETPPIKDIAGARAHVFNTCKTTKALVLDDDLIFSVRRKSSPKFAGFHDKNEDGDWDAFKKKNPEFAKLDTVGPDDARLSNVFVKIEKMLDTYRHGGISERYFNHTKGFEFTRNAKLLHALAYHVPTVREHCDIGWTKWHEDVDYTIQLMIAGFDNMLYNWAAVNEGRGWNASGGCSSYRKFAEQKPCAFAMAKKYPGIVVPYEKNTPFGPMWVCRVNWKKAIEQGKAKDLL